MTGTVYWTMMSVIWTQKTKLIEDDNNNNDNINDYKDCVIFIMMMIVIQENQADIM